MSPEKFIKNVFKAVDQLLLEDGEEYHLKTTTLVPFLTSYKPELNFSEELYATMTTRYRQLIGLLRWRFELGRLDTFLETSLLSQYIASPREGHLEAVYHIFAYLKKSNKTAIIVDPKYIQLDERAFSDTTIKYWQQIYAELAEELPYGMPNPEGMPVDITGHTLGSLFFLTTHISSFILNVKTLLNHPLMAVNLWHYALPLI